MTSGEGVRYDKQSDLNDIFSILSRNHIKCRMINDYCGIKGMKALVVKVGKYGLVAETTSWDMIDFFGPIYRISIDNKCHMGLFKVVSERKIRYLRSIDILEELLNETKNV